MGGGEDWPHAAVFIGDPTKPGTLYDPAGSYVPSQRSDVRKEGGLIFNANLQDYFDFHSSTGSTIHTASFPTSVEQENQIINDAAEIGGGLVGFCANDSAHAVSSILGGADYLMRPSTLQNNAQNARPFWETP